jgi:hypothetical protein
MFVTLIRWRDACQDEAAAPDTPLASASRLVELLEVGFLIGEDDESVSIAMECEPDGSLGRWRLHIPKVNIIERRDVELKKAFPLKRHRRSDAKAEGTAERT